MVFATIPKLPCATGILSPNFGETAGVNLELHVGSLLMEQGARISVSTISMGNAGSLLIDSTGDVVITSPQTGLFAGSGTDAAPGIELPDNLGNAGRITINTKMPSRLRKAGQPSQNQVRMQRS